MVTPVAPLILVVEDDPGIQRLVTLELRASGFDVLSAATGTEALSSANERTPDLVVLDLGLPDISGFDVMEALRGKASRWLPIILLTGFGSDSAKVEGLASGADDYLTKPFSPEELTARVRAVLRRRRHDHGASVVSLGDVEIDFRTRHVRRAGNELRLMKNEWKILEQLANRPDRTVLGRELLVEVWGPEFDGDLAYLRRWISLLRKKLEPDPGKPRYIVAVPSAGYKLVTKPPASLHDEDDSDA